MLLSVPLPTRFLAAGTTLFLDLVERLERSLYLLRGKLVQLMVLESGLVIVGPSHLETFGYVRESAESPVPPVLLVVLPALDGDKRVVAGAVDDRPPLQKHGNQPGVPQQLGHLGVLGLSSHTY